MSKYDKVVLVLNVCVFLYSSLMVIFHSITDTGSVFDVIFYAWLAVTTQMNGYEMINDIRRDIWEK